MPREQCPTMKCPAIKCPASFPATRVTTMWRRALAAAAALRPAAVAPRPTTPLFLMGSSRSGPAASATVDSLVGGIRRLAVIASDPAAVALNTLRDNDGAKTLVRHAGL